METVLRLLMLEDVPAEAELEVRMLRQAGIVCDPRVVETERDLLKQLDEFNPHLVLSDFTLPGFDGLAALGLVRERRPDIPYIFVSGTIGEERAVDALKRGATDYVLKDNLARLPPAVMRAVRDVEEYRRRTQQEQRESRLNRIRDVQAGACRAIVRVRDRRNLFREVCDVAVKYGRFRMAWVGLTVAGTTGLVPVAHSANDVGRLEEWTQAAGDVMARHAVIGRELKQGKEVLVNEIGNDVCVTLRESVLGHGCRSMIALPLVSGGDVIGFWLVYAEESGFFGAEETRLLCEIAADVSFALDYIAKQERLNELAYYDVLTGLSNRNLLHEHLKHALAQAGRNDRVVAVVFIDLDGFKRVNDTFGHGAGDRLLKEAAARIAACTRDGDIVARHGGDEFVMVLPDQGGPETVVPVLQRVLNSLSEAVFIEGRAVRVTCSIGVAFFPEDGWDAETVLNSADAAMYRAKEAGPGRFRFSRTGTE
jgi:diguanylate cyclase (GGDEF)-like protein